MIYEYTTNYQDFLAAQRLARKSKRRAKVKYFLYSWMLPALGWIAAAIVVTELFTNDLTLPPLAESLLTLFGTWSILLPLLRRRNMKRLYRQMKNGRTEQDKIVLELTDREMVSRIPDRGEGRILREAIHNFVEGETVALIYTGPQKFLLLPKRAVPDAEWPKVQSWFYACLQDQAET